MALPRTETALERNAYHVPTDYNRYVGVGVINWTPDLAVHGCLPDSFRCGVVTVLALAQGRPESAGARCQPTLFSRSPLELICQTVEEIAKQTPVQCSDAAVPIMLGDIETIRAWLGETEEDAEEEEGDVYIEPTDEIAEELKKKYIAAKEGVAVSLTRYQLALWLGDFEMAKLIGKYLPTEERNRQRDELFPRGFDLTSYQRLSAQDVEDIVALIKADVTITSFESAGTEDTRKGIEAILAKCIPQDATGLLCNMLDRQELENGYERHYDTLEERESYFKRAYLCRIVFGGFQRRQSDLQNMIEQFGERRRLVSGTGGPLLSSGLGRLNYILVGGPLWAGGGRAAWCYAVVGGAARLAFSNYVEQMPETVRALSETGTRHVIARRRKIAGSAV